MDVGKYIEMVSDRVFVLERVDMESTGFVPEDMFRGLLVGLKDVFLEEVPMLMGSEGQVRCILRFGGDPVMDMVRVVLSSEFIRPMRLHMRATLQDPDQSIAYMPPTQYQHHQINTESGVALHYLRLQSDRQESELQGRELGLGLARQACSVIQGHNHKEVQRSSLEFLKEVKEQKRAKEIEEEVKQKVSGFIANIEVK